MKSRRLSLIEYFKYLILGLIFGSIIISCVNIYNVKHNIIKKTSLQTRNDAIKLVNQVDNSLIYIENLTNLIANRVAVNNASNYSKIASILESVKPKLKHDKYGLFNWTLFDFVNPEGHVVATSVSGLNLKKNVKVTTSKRSWMYDARVEPWKFHISKSDIGMVSKEGIIPIGFGVTNKKDEFLGIISFGVNVNKLRKSLENSLTHMGIDFIILNNDSSIITVSENFNHKRISAFQRKVFKQRLGLSFSKDKFVKIDGRMFYFAHVPHYPKISILVGANKETIYGDLFTEVLPRILNTLYLTIFLVVLLYFFKRRFLSPIVHLSKAAEEISRGNSAVYVPISEINEVNLLSQSIEQVRELVEKQQQDKMRAEQDSFNKTEFLASTAHELKNIVSGIVGLAEITKSNLEDSNKKQEISDGNYVENIEFMEDIVKFGNELSTFIVDIIDVNQSKTGNFKIEEQKAVDVKDLVMRSVKLMKTHIIKSKQKIIFNYSRQNKDNFIIDAIDPRRIKQVIINIISNSIKYSGENAIIDVSLSKLEDSASNSIQYLIIENIKLNQKLSKTRKTQLLRIVKRQRPKIVITVKDNGMGMTEKEIKVALERYSSIKPKNKTVIDSSGIGLPLAKYLVEMQGGLMVINSAKNVGTEVKIFL